MSPSDRIALRFSSCPGCGSIPVDSLVAVGVGAFYARCPVCQARWHVHEPGTAEHALADPEVLRWPVERLRPALNAWRDGVILIGSWEIRPLAATSAMSPANRLPFKGPVYLLTSWSSFPGATFLHQAMEAHEHLRTVVRSWARRHAQGVPEGLGSDVWREAFCFDPEFRWAERALALIGVPKKKALALATLAEQQVLPVLAANGLSFLRVSTGRVIGDSRQVAVRTRVGLPCPVSGRITSRVCQPPADAPGHVLDLWAHQRACQVAALGCGACGADDTDDRVVHAPLAGERTVPTRYGSARYHGERRQLAPLAPKRSVRDLIAPSAIAPLALLRWHDAGRTGSPAEHTDFLDLSVEAFWAWLEGGHEVMLPCSGGYHRVRLDAGRHLKLLDHQAQQAGECAQLLAEFEQGESGGVRNVWPWSSADRRDWWRQPLDPHIGALWVGALLPLWREYTESPETIWGRVRWGVRPGERITLPRPEGDAPSEYPPFYPGLPALAIVHEMKDPKRRERLRANFAKRTACVICWRYGVPEWGQSVCATCSHQITTADTLISRPDKYSEVTRACAIVSVSVLGSALRLIPLAHHADDPVAVLRRIAEQPDSLEPLL